MYILKKACSNYPGIVIFTHKERIFFEKATGSLVKLLRKLQQKYLIGMHYGWFHEEPINDLFPLDFVMGAPGAIQLDKNASLTHVKMASRDFLPNYYKPDANLKKRWDIINISNVGAGKNLDQFLLLVKEILDKRPQTRVLLIANISSSSKASQERVRIISEYENKFSYEERQKFTLLPLYRGKSVYAIGREDLSYFLKSSRVLTLLSDVEGESRVISEALCCGLKVAVKRHLRGGGKDYLNRDNSILIDNLDEAADKFIRELGSDSVFSSEKIIKKTHSDFTLPILIAELDRLMKAKGWNWDQKIDSNDLDQKLPGHALLLPQIYRGGSTDDFTNISDMVGCLRHLLGLPKMTYFTKVGIETMFELKTGKRFDRAIVVALEEGKLIFRKFLGYWSRFK